MSHRLQQWVTRAPELEDETALANIALDLLGQARLLLTRAGRGRRHRAATRTTCAYLRDAGRVPQRPAGRGRATPTSARLIARLLVFATWRLALLTGCAPRATRCWPPSPPRASRSSPTTASTRRSGWSASATAPRTRTERMQAGAGRRRAADRRAVPTRTRSSSASPPPASPSTRRRCAPSSTRCWPRCCAGAGAAPAGRRRVRRRRPRTACTPPSWPAPGRAAERGPRHTRSDLVTPRHEAGAGRAGPGPAAHRRRRARPRAAHAHPRPTSASCATSGTTPAASS